MRSVGTWMSTRNLSFVEIAVITGYEWVVIDLEHSSLDVDFCAQACMVAAGRIEVYARIDEHNPALIKKLLDVGIDGIVAPMVETKESVISLYNALHYPPVGSRGVGLNRAQDYGLDFEGYLKKSKDIKLVIQIESANAIQNLDMLLDSSYVYAAIIGPYDLSASFNKPGVFDCLEMKQATAKFLSSCRSKKVMPGFHVVSSDSRKAIEKSEEGYEFLALGVDFIFLQEAMKKLITDISL